MFNNQQILKFAFRSYNLYRILAKINIKFVISMLAVLILFRISGDIMLYVSGGLENDSVVIWKFITSIPIILGLFNLFVVIRGIFNKKYEEEANTESNEKQFHNFFNRMTNYLGISLSVLIFIEYLRPSIISEYLLKKSLFQLILNDLFAVMILSFGFMQIFAHLRTTTLNKTKFNRLFEIAYLVLVCITFGLSISHNTLSDNFILAGNYLAYLATIILVIYSSNFSNAIATNEKKDIFLIILKSVVIIFLGSKVFHSLYSSHGHLRSTVEYFQSYSAPLIVYSLFITLLLYSKAIITALLSLPTNNLVRRKSSEFDFLRVLNEKNIAITYDLDTLLSTLLEEIDKKLKELTQSNHLWIEVYEDDTIQYYSYRQRSNEIAEKLHNDYSELIDFKSNYVVKENNIEKNQALRDKFNIANSFVIYPIKGINNNNDNENIEQVKVGNLILLSNETNVFTVDVDNVLTTISDNLSFSIYNYQLHRQLLEKKKLEREMELARDMQEKLLPATLPTIENYSIRALSQSAETVGGDYYDLVTLKNGSHCLLIGDVSGKGISASFYMAQFKGIIRASASESNSCEELLKKVNKLLFGNIDRKIYLTICSLEINDANGNITICRAGHMPIFLKQNGVVNTIKPEGIAIGIAKSEFFDKTLIPYKVSLNEGDSCLLFTDGLNEGKNKDGIEYGLDNLKQCIQNNVFTTGDELVTAILNDFEAYTNGVAPFDDVTIFALKYK